MGRLRLILPRLSLAMACALLALAGCKESTPDYGYERPLFLPGHVRQTWAVAPVINLSGQKEVDSILQADVIKEQLGSVAGIDPVPVDQVVALFRALGIEQVQSEEQASLVCDLLGVDALVVGTVMAYDPYEPPKLQAALQLFRKSSSYHKPTDVDPRELVRRAAPKPGQAMAAHPGFLQVVGMFDASNGSTRAQVLHYAQGRHDQESPYGERVYFIEMDRYCGFVYYTLIEELLSKPQLAAE